MGKKRKRCPLQAPIRKRKKQRLAQFGTLLEEIRGALPSHVRALVVEYASGFQNKLQWSLPNINGGINHIAAVGQTLLALTTCSEILAVGLATGKVIASIAGHFRRESAVWRDRYVVNHSMGSLVFWDPQSLEVHYKVLPAELEFLAACEKTDDVLTLFFRHAYGELSGLRRWVDEANGSDLKLELKAEFGFSDLLAGTASSGPFLLPNNPIKQWCCNGRTGEMRDLVMLRITDVHHFGSGLKESIFTTIDTNDITRYDWESRISQTIYKSFGRPSFLLADHRAITFDDWRRRAEIFSLEPWVKRKTFKLVFPSDSFGMHSHVHRCVLMLDGTIVASRAFQTFCLGSRRALFRCDSEIFRIQPFQNKLVVTSAKKIFCLA